MTASGDEVQEGLYRAAKVLGIARHVVQAVAGNRFSTRLLHKNEETLKQQARVLREVADALEQLSNELRRDYRSEGRPS